MVIAFDPATEREPCRKNMRQYEQKSCCRPVQRFLLFLYEDRNTCGCRADRTLRAVNLARFDDYLTHANRPTRVV